VGLSSRGFPLMRSGLPPVEGASVVSEDGSFRGRVLRIFGPVARPYVVVEPKGPLTTARAAALVGQDLWPEGRSHAR
jgi:rRNA processing protein Gar1